ncbi:ABC transporter substrate-binding protein [Pseudothermotoga sp.]
MNGGIVVKKVLFIVFVIVFAALSFAWTAYATPQDYRKATGKEIVKYSESPMLAELVKQGKLPPVEQRLPEEPLVIVPEEEVGQYGGTWRRAWKGLADRWGLYRIMAAHFVFWDKEGAEFLPGIAKKWDILEGGKTYIFYLRKGMKWSDGHPFTADDVVFYVEKIVGNNDLTPSKPTWYRIGGQPVKVTKIDDYTVRFDFAQPYPLFMMELARGTFCAPKHYLSQFHPDFTPMSEIEKKMVPGTHKTWVDLFNDRNDFLKNSELPTILTWKPVNDPSGQFFILERNPYFWAVDIAGNQLPYIDYIRNEYITDNEVILLKAISGELDFQWRHIGLLGAGLANYPILKENEKKGDYRVLLWSNANGSVSQLMLNVSDPQDPELGKVFNDVRFRRALSLAINRQEINEIFYNGLAEPRQASFVSGSGYFDPEWEKAYAEYDPERANKLLDEMGLKWDAKREYRLLTDGRPLRFTIQVVGQPHVDIWTTVKEHWKKIGVWVEIENLERSLYESRLSAHYFDAQVWLLDRAAQPLADPMMIIPGGSQYATSWYIGWMDWINAYLKGETPPANAKEPPAEVKKLLQIWEQIKTSTNPQRIKELMKEVTKIHRENLWMIGTVGEDPSPLVVKNNFRNVPEKLVAETPFFTPLNAMPMQFFFKRK